MPEARRQLAAIMFTDIVGYTAVMGESEQQALVLLQKSREIHKHSIEKYDGRWLKEMGDGTLSSFSTVTDAVHCANDIQEAIKSVPGLDLRVGIHLGEVVFEGNDVLGDGVNIASRIEALGQKGEIVVSETVYQNIRNQEGIQTQFIKEEHLKNVADPVKIYRIIVHGTLIRTAHKEAKIGKSITGRNKGNVFYKLKSKKLLTVLVLSVVILLAVFSLWKFLPTGGQDLVENRVAVAFFKNETGDASLDYLRRLTADIITDGIGQVSFVEATPVIPENERTLTNQNTDQIKRLSEKTGANIVVSGVFYQENNKLIFQPQVDNISSGKPLKTLQLISGDIADPANIIEDLSQRVLSLLAFKFDLDWKTYSNYMGHVPTYDAYKEFKEGWELYIGNDQYVEAIERFNKALELDSTLYHSYQMILGAFLDSGSYTEADSIVKILNRKRSVLTLNERKLLTFHETWLKGDLIGNLQISREIAEFDSDWGYNVGWGAVKLNRLFEAEEWFSKIDVDSSWVNTFESYWNQYGGSLHMLGKYKDELQVVLDRRNRFPESRKALVDEIIVYIAMGNLQNTLKLKKDIYVSMKGLSTGWELTRIAMEFSVHGYEHESYEYIEEAIQWFSDRPETEKAIYRIDLFDALFHSVFALNLEALASAVTLPKTQLISERDRRIQKIQQLAVELVAEDPSNENYLGRLGILYAQLGDHTNANRIHATLGDLDEPYIYGNNIFWKAAISAHFSEYSQAVALLYDASRTGYPFSRNFHRNTLWNPLRDHPEFIEFMEPRN